MLEEHGLEEGSTAFISSTKLDAVADHLLSLAKCVPHSLSAPSPLTLSAAGVQASAVITMQRRTCKPLNLRLMCTAALQQLVEPAGVT